MYEYTGSVFPSHSSALLHSAFPPLVHSACAADHVTVCPRSFSVAPVLLPPDGLATGAEVGAAVADTTYVCVLPSLPTCCTLCPSLLVVMPEPSGAVTVVLPSVFVLTIVSSPPDVVHVTVPPSLLTCTVLPSFSVVLVLPS